MRNVNKNTKTFNFVTVRVKLCYISWVTERFHYVKQYFEILFNTTFHTKKTFCKKFKRIRIFLLYVKLRNPYEKLLNPIRFHIQWILFSYLPHTTNNNLSYLLLLSNPHKRQNNFYTYRLLFLFIIQFKITNKPKWFHNSRNCCDTLYSLKFCKFSVKSSNLCLFFSSNLSIYET